MNMSRNVNGTPTVPRISVIVPTRNEEDLLPACLASIRQQSLPAEIVVSDGGSQDGTLVLAQKKADQLVLVPGVGLAAQLNAGAALASGDILLFLHADCILPQDALERIDRCLENPKTIGGAFTMEIHGSRFLYPFFSRCGNLYCHLTHTYFGDRGIFLRRSAYDALGGFLDIPFMSDVDLSHRMKRMGRTILVQGPIQSSSRKFDSEPPWQSIYLLFWSLAAYRLGVPPEQIRKKYYRENT